MESSLASIGLTTGTLLVAASALIILYNWPVWDRHLYPPGPLPLPFVGHLIWLATRQHTYKALYKLRDKYGDVMTVDLPFGTKVVLLNSAEAFWDGAIKNAEYLTERHFDGKNLFTPLGITGGGLNEKDGRWSITRKHMLSVFREHGIGGRGIEPMILQEASHLHRALHDTRCEPFDIHDLLTQATCNVITTVTIGSRYDYSDERLENIQLTEYVGLTLLTQAIPVLKYLPFDMLGFHRATSKARKGIQFLKDQVQRHIEEMDYESPPRDYTDSYLIKIKDHENDPSTVFTVGNLEGDLLGMYVAGTDTTSESLYWAFLYMVMYPDVQERVYDEVHEKLGEKSPSYTDRQLLPYTAAVMSELMRIASISTGTLMNKCSKDLNIMGHHIPAGTLVTGNDFSILINEELYPDPEKFIPERFLNDNGEYTNPDRKMLPFFGLGRRSCPGEQLAKSEYYIFLTSTIQKYKIELGQSEKPSLIGKRRLVQSVDKRYLIRAIPRE